MSRFFDSGRKRFRAFSVRGGSSEVGSIGIFRRWVLLAGVAVCIFAPGRSRGENPPVGFPGPLPPAFGNAEDRSTTASEILPPETWSQEGGGSSRNPSFRFPGEKTAGESAWKRQYARERVPGERSPLPEDFYAGVVESGGVLWMAGFSGDMLAIDARDGRLIWRRHVPSFLPSPPVLGPSTVYLAASEPGVTLDHLLWYAKTRTLIRGRGPGLVEALSRKSGAVRWSARITGGCYGSPVLLPHTVMVQTGSGHLVFLDRADGHEVFDLSLDGRSLGMASPVQDDRKVVVAQENPPLYQEVSLDGPRRVWRFGWTGTRDWEHFFIGTPLLVHGTFIGILRRPDLPGDRVMAVNPDLGRVLWSRSFPAGDLPRAGDQALPVESGEVVYVPSGVSRSLMAIEIGTGKRLWSTQFNERPSTGGVVTGDLLLLPLPSGRLLAIDARSGILEGERKVASRLGPHPPVVVGNRVFVAGEDGTVSQILLTEWGDKIRQLAFPSSPAFPANSATSASASSSGEFSGRIR